MDNKKKQRNELFSTIKKDLLKLFSFSAEKFSSYVLSDGTKITTENELIVGAEVFKLDELGNQSPLDKGDYVIEDGRTIVYDGSAITEIKDAQLEKTQEEVPVEDLKKEEEIKAEDMPVVEVETKEVETENTMDVRVADLEKMVVEILDILKTITEGQNKANEQMMSKMMEFGAEPGAQSIKVKKTGKSEYDDKNIYKASLSDIRSSVNFYKNKN
jgi:hypothetical protein